MELASLSSAADSCDLNECEVPHDTGSLRMNLTAFGLGVSCMSAIFGICWSSIGNDSNHYLFVNIISEIARNKQYGHEKGPCRNKGLFTQFQTRSARSIASLFFHA